MIFAFVNLDKWNSLPKAYQAVLSRRPLRQHLVDGEIRRRKSAGTKTSCLLAAPSCRPFSPPIMDAFYKSGEELHNEIAATNADFKKVLDAMLAFPMKSISVVPGCGI